MENDTTNLSKEDLIKYFKKCLSSFDESCNLIKKVENGFIIINFYSNLPEIKIGTELQKNKQCTSCYMPKFEYFISTEHNKSILSKEEFNELKYIWEERYMIAKTRKQKEEANVILNYLK